MRGAAMFEALNVPVLYCREHDRRILRRRWRRALAAERGWTFLGRVPMSADVRKGGDYGRPIAVAEPDSEAGQAFRTLAQTVAARVSVVMLQNADVIPLNVIG
ncbi:MAG: P-loop NTPase [Anaerolineae bacterium]